MTYYPEQMVDMTFLQGYVFKCIRLDDLADTDTVKPTSLLEYS